MSQEELARAAETDMTQIGGVERGVRNPSYSTLLRIAKALDSSVGAITTLADQRLASKQGSPPPRRPSR